VTSVLDYVSFSVPKLKWYFINPWREFIFYNCSLFVHIHKLIDSFVHCVFTHCSAAKNIHILIKIKRHWSNYFSLMYLYFILYSLWARLFDSQICMPSIRIQLGRTCKCEGVKVGGTFDNRWCLGNTPVLQPTLQRNLNNAIYTVSTRKISRLYCIQYFRRSGCDAIKDYYINVCHA
jgi:hypothetical protein